MSNLLNLLSLFGSKFALQRYLSFCWTVAFCEACVVKATVISSEEDVAEKLAVGFLKFLPEPDAEVSKCWFSIAQYSSPKVSKCCFSIYYSTVKS